MADARKHLVRNGLQRVRQHCYGQVVAENLHTIAFVTVYPRYIYHGYVHADIANILCSLVVHQAIAVAVAQSPVQSIGISNGYGRYHAIVINGSAARVAHCVASLNLAQLQNGGAQGAHIVDDGVVSRVNSV